MDIPKKLFKYRKFDTYALNCLTYAMVFYTDPTWFNDPLDCNPSINVDVGWKELERVCFSLLAKRKGKEEAQRAFKSHKYNSTAHGSIEKGEKKAIRAYCFYLAREIKMQLTNDFKRCGVLSLSETWDCPLMWSHYADNHKGICIEYSTEQVASKNLRPVQYDRPRGIAVSNLAKWLADDNVDERKMTLDLFFYSKAPQWHYEREWRDVNNKSGLHLAPLNVSAIYFGMRCDSAIVDALVRNYVNSETSPEFYYVDAMETDFTLGTREVETDYIQQVGVHNTMAFAFDDIDLDDDEKE